MKNLTISKIFFMIIISIFLDVGFIYINEKTIPNNDGIQTIEWELKKI
jgi:hypothetical protein